MHIAVHADSRAAASLLFVMAFLPRVAAAQLTSPPNGDFEQTAQSGLPQHWTGLSIGPQAEFASDRLIRKTGLSSMRITAKEITRSYIVSEDIPIGSGDKFSASMWVQHTNVPPGKGTVIAIAEFIDARHERLGVTKIVVADPAKHGWQRINGTVTAPENAAFLKLRLGFSYNAGTCWWDDVRIHFDRDISARIDIGNGRLSPANEAVPLVIINRSGQKARADLTLGIGGHKTKSSVQLTGVPLQQISIPARFDRPGKIRIQGSLSLSNAQVSFSAQGLVPPKLTLDPLIPTHWAVEDGAGTVKGTIHAALPKSALAKAKVNLQLLDSKNRIHTEHSISPVADGLNDFDLKVPALPEGSYTVIATLEADAQITTEQAWIVIARKKASVTLNKEGFPVSNGRVIFPLGIFNGGARMKELGENGFTVSHSYNTVEARVFGRPDDNRAKGFLDESERAGLKALMLIPRHALFAEDWETVRRRILMFRNHPGLLAWDEEEGIARGDMKLETLNELGRIVKELDPNHPLMVGDSHDVIGRIPPDRAKFFPEQPMDMGMWWWYPFPISANANVLEGDEAGSASNLPLPSFMVNATTPKPLWVGIQAYKKPGPTARYPNCAEYRFQVYAGICAGAKGLMWYGGSVTGGAYLKPDEADWDYIKTLAREVSQFAPVLTGQTLPKPRVTPSDTTISSIIKQGNGRTLLFAANRSMNSAQASIALPDWKTALAIPGHGPITLDSGVLSLKFAPLGVHICELR